ncbi:MAG: heparinase II/III family protein [Burkholderiales bacterium]|nr:heparinase II/III family protein [Burkholderiales bacterium]
MPHRRPAPLTRLACAALVLLAACQQPKAPQVDVEALHAEPPATGSSTCPALAADYLSLLPTHQRRIEPEDCSRWSQTPLFAWGEPRDRLAGSSYSLYVRTPGSGVLLSRTGLADPRLRLGQNLPAGNYEWAVGYTHTSGKTITSAWRRFSVEATARSLSVGDSAAASVLDLPDGAAIAAIAAAKARPRMLPTGSSYASLRTAAQQGDHAAVLRLLRSRAAWYVTQAIPANPDIAFASAGTDSLAQVKVMRGLVQTARSERFNIEYLALIGRLDGNAAMLSQARARTLALAAWSPTGPSSEKNADQANREVFLALAQGLDLMWEDFSGTERSLITTALRSRLLQTFEALSLLNTQPFDSHSQTNVRFVTQALMLAVGLPGFAEAQTLLTRAWEMGVFSLETWGKDGGFGNGTAYAWYAFNGLVPYGAAVRVMTGVNLYQVPVLRRAGEQLMAFTPPNWAQASAFGDEMETRNLYDQYSAGFYRLHAQQTRSPIDAWYWRAKPANVTAPNDASIWQVLLLGVDSSALPAPVAPAANDWFSADTGQAAMHVDMKRSDRTSVFFRASRYGAFNHSHADQNSLVYVSQGMPLLVNAGYYPYYNSPHHKNTRSTRFKNALTYDGGYGQSEVLGASKPADPFHSMDAAGALTRTQTLGTLSAVTGDATLAYRSVDLNRGTWTPNLSSAVRSVVMDKTNGVTLVYDWATSATARQWELNFHSPNPFAVNAASVSASNGAASVCLDRYGPASQFTQTSAWEVAPETAQAAQAHGRFTVLARSTEFAHLTVLRDSCRTVPVTVQQTGTQINVIVAGRQTAVFDKRALSLGP